jgi:uncharacterized protein (TIGR03382 family)
MAMKRLILGLAVVFGAIGTAAAEDNSSPASEATLQTPQLSTGRTFVGTTKGYVVVEPPSPEASVAHFSRIMFLNRCVGGCTVTYGSENSSNNRSSIAQGTLSAWSYGDAKWNQLVECVEEIMAPFDIDVTDVDPGQTEHMEALVAGLASQFGESNQILGFAPGGCGYIPRSMSFTFANNSYYASGGGDIDELCATVGQEIAHTWGLDHEMLASDPMTYLQYNGRRHFQNQAAPCGEYQNRSCNCGGSTQNSYNEILAIFGSAEPTPPNITITQPANGAQVAPGFPVHAEADEALLRAELLINNQVVQTITSPPYTFNAPVTLGDGTYQVTVRGFDIQDTPGSETISVIIGEPCDTPADCQEVGENYTCVDGRCVPGEGAPGGLGTECTDGTQCFSGICLGTADISLCVEVCTLGEDGCPGGYDCVEDGGGGGVCWPGDGGGDDGGGGTCATGGNNPTLPIGLGLLFTGLVLRRRRRA